ncbi:MAG: hypothetical protein HC875_30265 [Anaerolineales bacterium]|nr:hypothetical protein [Anaerolineales bacterium]
MLCPFCLSDVKFKQTKPNGSLASIYLCSDCKEPAPALYVQDYRQYPPVVISATGFRQHGKTVYFAALFYTLKKLSLARDWPDFFTMGLNEDSLDTVYGNVRLLEGGALPDSTPKNFPRPTMIRVDGVPIQPDCTLLFFDTGGECFEKPTQLVQFAGFVRRAKAAMLLVSVPDLEDPRSGMQKLLNTYVVGMRELGGQTEEQDLVVVYTKADQLATRFSPTWEDLRSYLIKGSLDDLVRTKNYIERMHKVSERLLAFTEQELHAHEFVNAAEANFKSVNFSIISALGSGASDGRLPVAIAPRRILDPLLWGMEKSFSGSERLWQRWLNWLSGGD